MSGKRVICMVLPSLMFRVSIADGKRMSKWALG
jgi:hypothetical protein